MATRGGRTPRPRSIGSVSASKSGSRPSPSTPGEPKPPAVIFGPFSDRGQIVTPCYWGSHWPLARGNATGSTIDDRDRTDPLPQQRDELGRGQARAPRSAQHRHDRRPRPVPRDDRPPLGLVDRHVRRGRRDPGALGAKLREAALDRSAAAPGSTSMPMPRSGAALRLQVQGPSVDDPAQARACLRQPGLRADGRTEGST